MTNLVAQIRLLKNNDPEAGEEARGWNNAIDAVLELLPDEPKAPPCDLIPIVSPSAVCGLIGCTNQHVHTHDVREPVNRPASHE